MRSTGDVTLGRVYRYAGSGPDDEVARPGVSQALEGCGDGPSRNAAREELWRVRRFAEIDHSAMSGTVGPALGCARFWKRPQTWVPPNRRLLFITLSAWIVLHLPRRVVWPPTSKPFEWQSRSRWRGSSGCEPIVNDKGAPKVFRLPARFPRQAIDRTDQMKPWIVSGAASNKTQRSRPFAS